MPPAERPAPAGSTRETPRALLLLAALAVLAALATGIYEASQGRTPPAMGPAIEITR